MTFLNEHCHAYASVNEHSKTTSYTLLRSQAHPGPLVPVYYCYITSTSLVYHISDPLDFLLVMFYECPHVQ